MKISKQILLTLLLAALVFYFFQLMQKRNFKITELPLGHYH